MYNNVLLQKNAVKIFAQKHKTPLRIYDEKNIFQGIKVRIA